MTATVDPMLGYSAADVRAAERPLLDAGVPLMSRASAGLAAVAGGLLAARGRPFGRVLVLAGSDGNGGDALFAAAILAASGCPTVVARLGRSVLAAALAAARHAGAVVLPRDVPAGRVAAEAARADLVLDGLLGIGAAGGLRPPLRQLIAALEPAVAGRGAVLAVDLPSGLGADDGRVASPVLSAATTVTFGAMKAGLLLAPPGVVGRLVLIDIGLADGLAGAHPLVIASGRPPVAVQVRMER